MFWWANFSSQVKTRDRFNPGEEQGWVPSSISSIVVVWFFFFFYIINHFKIFKSEETHFCCLCSSFTFLFWKRASVLRVQHITQNRQIRCQGSVSSGSLILQGSWNFIFHKTRWTQRNALLRVNHIHTKRSPSLPATRNLQIPPTPILGKLLSSPSMLFLQGFLWLPHELVILVWDSLSSTYQSWKYLFEIRIHQILKIL